MSALQKDPQLTKCSNRGVRPKAQTVLSPPRLPARILNVKPPRSQNCHFCHRFPGEDLSNSLTGIFNIFSFSASRSPPIAVICPIPSLISVAMGANWGSREVCAGRRPPCLPEPEGLHPRLSSATWLNHPPGQALPRLLPLELLPDARGWEVRTEGFPPVRRLGLWGRTVYS